VKKKILVVTPLEDQGFTWVVEGELRDRYDWTFINLGNMNSRSWQIVFDAFMVKQQKKYDLVISMDFYLTLGLAIKKYLFGGIDTHFSYGFNKSRDSFLERLWMVRFLMSRALKACDCFVVHSTAERAIFSDYFYLPVERFLFRHWGADLSSYTKEDQLRDKFSIFDNFICAIGRNNRDYELLFRAVKDLDVSVVVVAPDYTFAGLDVPCNVKLLSGLSMSDSLGLISAAMVNVVPIKDATRGAGHMTVAFAMHMGRPQIITDVDTIHDYFTADQVIAVEHGSVLSMREAIEYLSASASARKVLGDNAVLFADKWLSSAGVSRSLLGILKDWESGNKSSFLPVGFDV
jgi:glycosyltransferase involved in cell wall biosynthesis